MVESWWMRGFKEALRIDLALALTGVSAFSNAERLVPARIPFTLICRPGRAHAA